MSDSEWRPEDLRELAQALARDTGWSDDDCDILREAASEINRLRTAVENIRRDAIDGENDLHGVKWSGPAKRMLRAIQNECEDVLTRH